MRLSCSYLPPVLALSLLFACSSNGSGDQTTDESSITDGPGTATMSSAPGSAGEPTSEGELPAACEEVDPSVSSKAEILASELMPDFDEYDFDVLCTIMYAGVVAGIEGMSIELSCDVDGSTHFVGISAMPELPEGEFVWEEGQAVRLIAFAANPDPGDREILFQLRDAADDTLLAAGMQSPHVDHSAVFAPLTFAYEYACGPHGQDVPLRIDLGLPGGASAGVFSGHRGQLPIDAEHAYVIDVEEAVGNHCCINELSFKVLVRRVRLGG